MAKKKVLGEVKVKKNNSEEISDEQIEEMLKDKIQEIHKSILTNK